MNQSTETDPQPASHHVVIVGGGFGGMYTALRLQKLARKIPLMRITLISRDNFFLMTPLLFEAGSGILEPRHAVNPLRPLFKRVQFVEGEVIEVDFDKKQVKAQLSNNDDYVIQFDQIVIALGSVTNTSLVKGAEHAQTFKTMSDGIRVRNHLIDCFERADVELHSPRRKAMMTFVIVGGGLVGVELMGELTEFVENVKRHYRNIPAEDLRFVLFEGGPRIMAEMSEDLSAYATKILTKRGVAVRCNVRVKAMEKKKVVVSDTETIDTDTIIISTGVRPAPLVEKFPLNKDRRGRIATETTMRSTSHPFVWALGDNAAIPDPKGHCYPPLAQHALREARQLAKNIVAVYQGKEPGPFVYQSKGTLASLGRFKGVGKVYKLNVYGFVAWWVWRTYYLFQMPRINRRLRIMMDWTISLVFHNDVVKLDVTCPQPASPDAPHEQKEEQMATEAR
jgi:NADH dehydrogenase